MNEKGSRVVHPSGALPDRAPTDLASSQVLRAHRLGRRRSSSRHSCFNHDADCFVLSGSFGGQADHFDGRRDPRIRQPPGCWSVHNALLDRRPCIHADRSAALAVPGCAGSVDAYAGFICRSESVSRSSEAGSDGALVQYSSPNAYSCLIYCTHYTRHIRLPSIPSSLCCTRRS